MSLPQVATLLDELVVRLRAHLDARTIASPRFAGIRTGGVWIAEAVAARCGAGGRGGVIDIGFHRDDVGQRAELPRLGPSSIPWDINDHDIVLVDDILQTGRTARAALNALFDWGRPRSVTLAVLVDLPGRELPVQPDVVGASIAPRAGHELRLLGPDPLELAWVSRGAGAPLARASTNSEAVEPSAGAT